MSKQTKFVDQAPLSEVRIFGFAGSSKGAGLASLSRSQILDGEEADVPGNAPAL